MKNGINAKMLSSLSSFATEVYFSSYFWKFLNLYIAYSVEIQHFKLICNY